MPGIKLNTVQKMMTGLGVTNTATASIFGAGLGLVGVGGLLTAGDRRRGHNMGSVASWSALVGGGMMVGNPDGIFQLGKRLLRR